MPTVIVILTALMGVALLVGSLRLVEPDPLARARRRWSGEVVGVVLIGLTVVAVAISNGAVPNHGPLEKGPRCLFGGLYFALIGTLCLISYYWPTFGTVFGFLSWCADSLPGPGDRSMLLFMGIVFGLAGVVGVVVGSGLFG